MISSIGNWVYVIMGLMAAVAMGVLVYIAWWALFADRANGRRRCPRCWYDLAGTPGMTCSECGYTAWSERRFGRTHRRYGVAAVAIVANVALALLINEHFTQRGWTSTLPTRVLIWTLPLTDGPRHPIYKELTHRINTRSLSDEQWRAVVKRFAAGDWWTRPASDGWISKYGDFLSRYRRGFLDDEAVEAALIDLPPRVDASVRADWPAGVPVIVGVQVRDWWPWGMECRVHATPRLPGAKTTSFCRSGDDRWFRPPFMLPLPPLPATAHDVAIEFSIERRRSVQAHAAKGRPEPIPEEPWRFVSRQVVTVPVRQKDSLDDLLIPVADAVLDDAMANAFQFGAIKWDDGPSPVRLRVDLTATNRAEFEGVAIGVGAELRQDDALARRLNLWWLGGQMSNPDRQYGYEVEYENLDLLQNLNEDDGRWRIVVRSDPRLALNAGSAKKYWSGELSLPLKVHTVNGQAPKRVWWFETESEESGPRVDE